VTVRINDIPEKSGKTSHTSKSEMLALFNPLVLQLSAQCTLKKTCALNGHHCFACSWQLL
jgi:hypothetical protein